MSSAHRSSPVWLPKKNPLSERTIQRVKTLMDAYTIHGQVSVSYALCSWHRDLFLDCMLCEVRV